MAEEMRRLHEAGTPYRDMTVLYRAHYVTRAVEEVLLGEKIPYTIYSGVQFFDRMEIKDRPLLPADDRLQGTTCPSGGSPMSPSGTWGSGGWRSCRNTRSGRAARCIRH